MKRFVINTALGLLALSSLSAQALLLDWSSPTQTVNNGDTVTVDLVASGLGDDTLSVFDLDVTYDASALAIDSFSYGDALGSIDFFEATEFGFGDDGAGTLSLGLLSFLENDAATCIFCDGPYLADLQGDSFVLASVSIQIVDLAVGAIASLRVGNVFELGDGFGGALALDGEPTRTTFVGADNPTPVPEPGVLLLILSGLFAFGLAVARKVPVAQ